MRRDVVIDGRRIAAREKGPDGRGTIVLLHGLGTHQRSWDRVAKLLDDFRVVTFDYGGHGRSDSSDQYSVEAMLADLEAVIAQTSVNSGYVLVGHSIGADLALLHASNSVQCEGIVLVDGALTASPPETDWEKFSMMEDRFFYRTLMFVGRRLAVAPSMSLQEIRALTEELEKRRRDFGEHLARLGAPALYVIGDQADKVPDGQLIHERKMSAISDIATRYDVRVEYVACGHLVPMRQSKRLGEMIREFSTSVLM